MQSKRYSPSTIQTYSEALKIFLQYFYQKEIEEITNDDVILFNNEYILKRNLSSSYQNQVVNAIKLFFRQVENRTINIDIIHRPKRQKLLPNVFGVHLFMILPLGTYKNNILLLALNCFS